MDFSKLDAALSAALDRDERSLFSVLVRFTQPLKSKDLWALRTHGLSASEGETIVNGSLAVGAIDELSDLPTVGSIRLSGNRRFA